MSSPTVNTKHVTGRRTVRYESFDDVRADAEHLAKCPTRVLGNWSVGQIFKHLAKSLDAMIDGPPFALPKPMQWFFRTFLKRRFTTRTLPAGFQLPQKPKAQQLVPDPTTPEEGLCLLRAAVNRVRQTETRAAHGAFGQCSREDWDAFQLRHCELHMSFILPVE